MACALLIAFARNNPGDMKLCVEGDRFTVSQTN
jgi:hypothetical protein